MVAMARTAPNPPPRSRPPPRFEPPKGFETRFRDLELHLAAFDGPLDLLLHLIREQKLDILDLPMADVTRQYMDYLLLMEELNLEIAAEFVAMAAQLLQIKSRMMLPRPPAEEGEEDPREDLVQRLLDYQQVKAAAQVLSGREADWHQVVFAPGLDLQEHAKVEEEPIRATLFDLLGAYREALKRFLPPPPVEVRTAPKTLDQRIQEVLAALAVRPLAAVQQPAGRGPQPGGAGAHLPGPAGDGPHRPGAPGPDRALRGNPCPGRLIRPWTRASASPTRPAWSSAWPGPWRSSSCWAPPSAPARRPPAGWSGSWATPSPA